MTGLLDEATLVFLKKTRHVIRSLFSSKGCVEIGQYMQSSTCNKDTRGHGESNRDSQG